MFSLGHDQDKTIYWIIIPLLFLLFLVPPFVVYDWDNYQFILLATVPMVYLAFSFIKTKKLEILVDIKDLAWLLFIGFGILSFSWAINKSLVLFPFFGWSMLYLWMLIFRSKSARIAQSTLLHQSLIILFFLLIIPTILVLSWKQSGTIPNAVLGYHRNYITTFLLGLFSFVLFAPWASSQYRLLQLVGSFLCICLIYLSGCRGGLLVFALLILIFIWSALNKKLRKFSVGISLVLLMALIGGILFEVEAIQKLPFIKEFYESNELDRFYMIRNSIWLFLERPLTGIGWGNWQIEAYKYGISEFVDFNDPLFLNRWGNHNILSQYLAELGIIGFIAFLFLFYYPVILALKNHKKSSPLQLAALGVLITYVVSIFLYQSPFLQQYFSGLQLLAMVSLGILTSQFSGTHVNLNSHGKGFLLCLSISAFIWFIYNKRTYDIYLEATGQVWVDMDSKLEKLETIQHPQLKKTIAYYLNNFVRDPIPLNSAEKISLLESIYHPLFKNSIGQDKSIALELALLHQADKDQVTTEKYFQQAISTAPYNEKVMLAYAKFLFKEKKELQSAEVYTQRIFKIQPNYIENRILLAEIAIHKKQFQMARDFLRDLNYLKGERAESVFKKRKGMLKSQVKTLQDIIEKETN